jgi:tryptophanyl-tRNA synthetase
MEHIKFITKQQFVNIIKGDIEKMSKSDREGDLIFEDPNEAIYEVFCGYQTVEKNQNLERQGIDFSRLKDMNRLFSAKMSDAGISTKRSLTLRIVQND